MMSFRFCLFVLKNILVGVEDRPGKEMRSNTEILVIRNDIKKYTKDHQQAVKLARAWGKCKIVEDQAELLSWFHPARS